MGSIITIGGGPALVVQQGASFIMKTGGVNYSELILASNPVGFWKLDETSGTTAADSSTNSQDGTYTGQYIRLDNDSIVAGLSSSLYQNSEKDTAAFNGDTYVDILDSVAGGHPYTDIGNSNNYTLEAWVQTPMEDTGDGSAWFPDLVIIELRKEAAGGSNDAPFAFGIDNGFLALGRDNGGTNQIILDTTPVGDNAIHHVVAVVTVDTVDFYVDGVFSSSGTFTTSIGDMSVGATTANMQIGSRARDGGEKDDAGYVGMLGAVALYETALSAPTILSHYNAGTGQTAVVDRGGYAAAVMADSPASWWRLGEANGSTVATDSGSNGQDGAYESVGLDDVGQPPLIMDVTRGFHRDVGSAVVRILDSVAGGHSFTSVGNSDFSVEAWIYIRVAPGAGSEWRGAQTILELRQEQAGGAHVSFSFGLESTFRVILGMTDDYVTGDEKAESIDNVFTLNTIHHVVVTCTVTGSLPSLTRSFDMYVDGAAVTVGTNQTFSTTVDDVTVGSTTSNMQIGYRSLDGGGLGNPVNGWIDEVAFYNSVLSPARVLAHYNAGVA